MASLTAWPRDTRAHIKSHLIKRAKRAMNNALARRTGPDGAEASPAHVSAYSISPVQPMRSEVIEMTAFPYRSTSYRIALSAACQKHFSTAERHKQERVRSRETHQPSPHSPSHTPLTQQLHLKSKHSSTHRRAINLHSRDASLLSI